MHASKQRLYHRLLLAAHHLRKAADRAVGDAVGLSTAQVSVLSVLVQEGKATQRTIARELGLNESAVTPMVGRLMGLGLIVRNPDKNDARAWSLELSEAGKDVIKKVKGPFSTINAVLDDEFTPEEIVEMSARLQRIIAAFE
jgi:MarR family transcriptional regulator, organic hydroperoxide resistance regulator